MTPPDATDEPASQEDPVDRLLQTGLDRLAAGDPAAKTDLIEAAYGRLTKRAHQMLGGFRAVRGSYDTLDVVQEACLRLARSLDAIHPENPRRFLGLAGLEIRRVLIDLYRHCRGPESDEANRGTNVFLGDDGEVHHHVDNAEAAGDDADLHTFERLHQAAQQLDEADQELFHMKWFLGMTHAQIADQFGCSDKTVKRNWSRVKDTLWRHMSGDSGA